MALNANKAGNGGNKNRVEQPKLEAGNYPGRLVQIIDLGLQPQRPYQGKDKPPMQEVMWTYELVDAFLVDENGKEREDKPRWVSETLPFHNLKADKAKSTQRINALDPEGKLEGDISQMLDTPVNVTIVINEKDGRTYENIGGTSPMRPRDAAKCPELKNPVKLFDSSEPDMEVFNSLPEWIQNKIKGNLNFKGSKLAILLGGKAEDKDKNDKADDSENEEPPFDTDDNPY